MVKAIAASPLTDFSPPRHSRALGWRLGVSTVLIISLVMGGISIGQQFLQLREQQLLQQKLLAMSLAPLAVDLEAAPTIEIMHREVEEFHTAYMRRGYSVHEVVLRDAANEPVFSLGESNDGKTGAGNLQAVIPIASSLLYGGSGDLSVSVNSVANENAVSRGWWLWTIHFTVTLGVLVLFLATAIYFQVTKPVGRLVEAVKKMEKGYWRPADPASGAWEIRWLAWRFGSMAREVQTTMTHFLEAEKMARSLPLPRTDASATADAEEKSGSDSSLAERADGSAARDLLAVCDRLEAMHPGDPGAAALGRGVWQREAVEANRLGLFEIKSRLEDAALRLTEPVAYRRLSEKLAALKEPWRDWMEQCRDAIYRQLEESEIPCVDVMYRVKHTAGVWAKMQSKGLRLDEVPDLFAFRIIVPTEVDCYAALGIIHQKFKPDITRFKDYIAKPKENGYRSIHTCVVADVGPEFELQIRSIAMDRQAERGNAAHWVYKRDGRGAGDRQAPARWWQKLLRRAGARPAP